MPTIVSTFPCQKLWVSNALLSGDAADRTVQALPWHLYAQLCFLILVSCCRSRPLVLARQLHAQ